MQRIDRRWKFPRVRGRTVVDGDPRAYFQRLGPIKLFRRAFLEAHDLRFPEGLVRLEDGILLSRGYLLAKRVSVLRDYGYYFRRRRDAEDNISLRRIQPAGYLSSVRLIADNVRDLCEDAQLADDIILDLYQRKALRCLRTESFLTFPPARRRAWVQHAARLADQHIPRELQQRLTTVPRLQSEFVRRGDVAALIAIAEAVQANRRLLVVTSRQGIHLEVDGKADRDVTDLVTLPDKALVVRGSRALRTDTHAVAISLVRSVLARTRRRVRR